MLLYKYRNKRDKGDLNHGNFIITRVTKQQSQKINL